MKSTSAWAFVTAAAFALAASGCKDEAPAPPLASLKPKPLPEVVADDAFRVEAAEVFGAALPKGAARLVLRGERATLDGAPFDAGALAKLAAAKRAVVVVPDADTFLAQASSVLAALDDAGVSVSLLHPEGAVAFPLNLSDEAEFQRWLDEQSTQGRIRVIHRADGYELQTHVGKVLGYDPNGPSIPLRGGRWDVARLRTALSQLRERFDGDTDVCLVPSFGTELAAVSTALTAFYAGADEPLFERTCLVYPRPR